jgi:hypothetical protein
MQHPASAVFLAGKAQLPILATVPATCSRDYFHAQSIESERGATATPKQTNTGLDAIALLKSATLSHG